MEYNTSALCDNYIDVVDVVEPMFSNYGGCNSFGGSISTIKCFEDNGLIMETLENQAKEKYSLSMVVVHYDVPLSMPLSHRLLSIMTGRIIVYGSVRDVDALEDLDIGIQAMASIPVGAESHSVGELEIPVNFGGVTFYLSIMFMLTTQALFYLLSLLI